MLQTINDWKLSRKMMAAFVAIGALLAVMAGTGIYTNSHLNGIAQTHVSRGIAGTERLSTVLEQIRELRLSIWGYHTAVGGEVAPAEQRLQNTRNNLNDAISSYSEIAGDDFMPEVERLRDDVDALYAVNERIYATHRAGNTAESLALIKGEGKQRSEAALAQANRLQEMSAQRAARNNEEGQDFATLGLTIAVVLALVSLAGLVAIWMLIQKTVAQPMEQLSQTTTALAAGGTAAVPHQDRADELGHIAKAVESFRLAAVERAEKDARAAAEQQHVTAALEQSLDALSQGDLTAEVTAEFPTAYQRLKSNFNMALANLRELLGAANESAMALRTGSQEIAQASEDLARRTESNAASLEETSAALTQIDGRIKATADASRRTVERADEAISTVSGGRSIADEAVQAMSRVRDSAKGIDEVIEGVDKIAFQTRVLAMNAAVEAGRAGDAGRGFAVVADLVSALAMRAEEEAKRARDQLTVTQTDIVTAVDAVQRVDGALAGISEGVSEVHELLGSMAADNQAQASAITQISSAVANMDQATQQNAAMVEQTSAAARNLNNEVEVLAEKAMKFRIDHGTPAPVKAPARPAAPAPKPAPKLVAKPAAKANGYVSPVKPLPVAGMAKANGNGALAHADDDWKDF